MTTPPRPSASSPRLTVVPVTQAEAFAFIAQHHRHHAPPQGWLWGCVACHVGGADVLGVVVVSRPARMLQDGWTVQVSRMCSSGERNVCSLLYGAARRASLALGYTFGVTYIRVDECGSSLRASGWRQTMNDDGTPWVVAAESHSREGRERTDKTEIVERYRFEFGERRSWARPVIATGKVEDVKQTSMFDLIEEGEAA